jgi:hypothetical protein
MGAPPGQTDRYGGGIDLGKLIAGDLLIAVGSRLQNGRFSRH